MQQTISGRHNQRQQISVEQPRFLVTKPDGSTRSLVYFWAVNAKAKVEFCALPSLEDKGKR